MGGSAAPDGSTSTLPSGLKKSVTIRASKHFVLLSMSEFDPCFLKNTICEMAFKHCGAEVTKHRGNKGASQCGRKNSIVSSRQRRQPGQCGDTVNRATITVKGQDFGILVYNCILSRQNKST